MGVLLVTSACGGNLGTVTPGCVESRDANGAHIIQAQTVPSASFVPCVSELKPGWEYNDLAPESGRTRFEIDSDRVGNAFLTVTLTASCDIGDAEQTTTDEQVAELFVDVEESSPTMTVVVVPDEEPQVIYARGILIDASDLEIRGRRVVFTIDDETIASATRVARALETGAPVLAVDRGDVSAKTVTLHLPGRPAESELSLETAIDEIDDVTEDMRYQGFWYYLFEGGCVTYEFDAEGPGAHEVAADAAAALGLFDVQAAVDFFRDEGLNL